MFQNLLTAHYDTYRPEFSHSLVNSVKSYINSKLDYEQKTPDFINDVRRKLYLIHEYNCQVAKLTHKYPRSRKFDLLLIKYVELEFEVLYLNNQHPPKQLEVITELRVLRLLQVMLYQAVLTNESLISGNTDAILKKAVLKLLGDVKPAYLTENKLVHNIANKLLKRVNGTNHEFNCSTFNTHEIHKNLATSDYGTDDNDSDFENDFFNKNAFDNKFTHKEKPTLLHTSDCVEVPLIVKGIVPVPTIEFVDDDNYMVYLRKKFINRRFENNHRESAEILSNKLSSDRNLILSGGKNCDQKKTSAQNKEADPTSRNNCESDCIILCSDSEEEISDLSLNNHKTAINKEPAYRKSRRSENLKEKINESQGVVTFELIDDDNDEPNYMVYLQKEVETNRTKKPNLKSTKINSKEIIICSDSEDDVVTEISEKNNNAELSMTAVVTEDENNMQELNVQEDIDSAVQEREKYNEDTLEEILNFVDKPLLGSIEDCGFGNFDKFFNHEQLNPNDTASVKKVEEVVIYTADNTEMDKNEENTFQILSASSQQNANFLMLENEFGINVGENSQINFLIDPSVIFEEMTYPCVQSKTEEFALTKYNNPCESLDTQELDMSNPDCLEELIDRPNALGGPVLSEKFDDFESFDNLQECRINDSMLELLLDDNYLLEGRKEFEELECFLFDDNNKGDLGFYNMTTERNDPVFSKNIKGLESLLNESQIFTESNAISSPKTAKKSCHDGFVKRRKRKCIMKIKQNKSKKFSENKLNILEDFKVNASQGFNLKKKSKNFLHNKEIAFQANPKRKSYKANIR